MPPELRPDTPLQRMAKILRAGIDAAILEEHDNKYAALRHVREKETPAIMVRCFICLNHLVDVFAM